MFGSELKSVLKSAGKYVIKGFSDIHEFRKLCNDTGAFFSRFEQGLVSNDIVKTVFSKSNMRKLANKIRSFDGYYIDQQIEGFIREKFEEVSGQGTASEVYVKGFSKVIIYYVRKNRKQVFDAYFISAFRQENLEYHKTEVAGITGIMQSNREIRSILEEYALYNQIDDWSALRSHFSLPYREYKDKRNDGKVIGRKWLARLVEENLVKKSNCRMFFLLGKELSGKTTFSESLDSFGLTVVAQVYMDNDSQNFSKLDYCIAEVVCQLAESIPEYFDLLSKSLRKNRGIFGSGKEKFRKLLVEPLSKLAQRTESIIVIDGVDTIEDLRELILCVREYHERLPEWVKFFITVPNSQSVKSYISNTENSFAIDISDPDMPYYRKSNEDILLYYEKKLLQRLINCGHSEQEIRTFFERLIEAGDGMFSYATLFCDSIDLDKTSSPNLANITGMIPDGIYDLYFHQFEQRFSFLRSEKTYSYAGFWREPIGMLMASPSPIPLNTMKTMMKWDENQTADFLRPISSLVKKNDELFLSNDSLIGWLDSAEKAKLYYSSRKDGLRNLAIHCYELYESGEISEHEYVLMYLTRCLRQANLRDYYEIVKEDQNIVNRMLSLADTYIELNRVEDAIVLLIEIKELFGEDTKNIGFAEANASLARLYEAKEDYNRAEKTYLEALRVYDEYTQEDVESRQQAAEINNRLGIIFAKKGKYDSAKEKMMVARELYGELIVSRGKNMFDAHYANVCCNCGVICSRNETSEAERLFEESLNRYREIAGLNNETIDKNYVWACEQYAGFCIDQSRFDKAKDLLREALEEAKKSKHTVDYFWVMKETKIGLELAEIFALDNDYANSVAKLEEICEFLEPINNLDTRGGLKLVLAGVKELIATYYSEMKNTEKMEQYFREAIRIADELMEMNDDKEEKIVNAIKLRGWYAGALSENAMTKKATEVLKKNADLLIDKEQFLGRVVFTELSVKNYNSLGEAYAKIGAYDEAKKSSIIALEQSREMVLSTSRRAAELLVAESLQNIGMIYSGIGENDNAEVSLLEARTIYQKYYDSDGEEYRYRLARTNEVLGCLYIKMKRTEMAEEKLIAALNEYKRENSPFRRRSEVEMQIARVNAELGSLRFFQGDLKASEEYYRNALDEIHNNEGSEKTSLRLLMDVQSKRALLFMKTNKYSLAVEQFSDNLTKLNRFAEIFDSYEYDSYYAENGGNLASCFSALKKFDEARLWFEKVISISRKYADNDDPKYLDIVVTTCQNYGGMLVELGEYNCAMELFDEAADVCQYMKGKGLKRGEALLLSVEYNLGIVHLKKGALDEAKKIWKTLLDNAWQLDRANNQQEYLPLIGTVKRYLADVYFIEGGKVAKAEKLLDESMRIFYDCNEKSRGAYEANIAAGLIVKSKIEYSKGNYEEYEKILLDVLQRYRMLSLIGFELFGQDVAFTYSLLGKHYMETERCREAVSLFREAIKWYRKLCDTPTRRSLYGCNIVDINNCIGDYYEKKGNRNLAVKRYLSATVIQRKWKVRNDQPNFTSSTMLFG